MGRWRSRSNRTEMRWRDIAEGVRKLIRTREDGLEKDASPSQYNKTALQSTQIYDTSDFF